MSNWIPTVAAVAATLVALVVLWPLRGHNRRLPFIGACVAIGIAGFSLYSLVGTPEAADAAREDPTSLSDGVRDLEQALAREPQRADGWALLGRSELALGNLDKANQAFARAAALAPDEVPLLVEAAQARAQGHAAKQFDDTALQWLKHAQQLEPNSERAGWLIGIAQRQRGQDAEAAATWEALLPRLEPAAANALREQIAIAREKAGMPAATGEATAPSIGLYIEVTLAAGKQLPPGTQVFVIARIPGGPPMPVAVQKHPATDLPLKIRLTDADSPMPTAKLSSLEAVEVFARLSASGQANRQQGDRDSPVVTVKLPHKGKVQLTL